MIVKNEEQFLERCLNSAQALVDEIIIVDTGSTDRTKEIAKKFTDKIFDFPWNDDFSAARNESLKHVTKDWVLVLDADEVINSADHQTIQSLVQNTDNTVGGFVFERLDYTTDEKTRGAELVESDAFVQQHDPQKLIRALVRNHLVRLFRNAPEIRFKNKVHELVEYSLTGRRIEKTSVPIHHFECLRPADALRKKQEWYSQLAEQKIREKPGDAQAYYELATTVLSTSKNWDKACELLEKAITLDETYTDAQLDLLYVYAKLHREKDAVSLFEKIAKNAKNNPPAAAYFNLGVLYYDTKQYAKALPLFANALKRAPENIQTQYLIGVIFMRQKKYAEAKVFFQNVIKRNPRHAPALVRLGAIAYKEKSFGAAKQYHLKAQMAKTEEKRREK